MNIIVTTVMEGGTEIRQAEGGGGGGGGHGGGRIPSPTASSFWPFSFTASDDL